MDLAPPLLLTSDDALAAAVLRLAAAAGAPLDVVPAPGAGLRGWGLAAAVLVGADQARASAAASLPRREDVHIVVAGRAPDTLFRWAVDLGAASVLELPAADDWLVAMLTDVGDGGRTPGVAVAVVGGSGGVGATVLTGALALAAAQRTATVMAVDLDPLGPGLPRVMGLEAPAGATWRELGESPGRLGSRALRDSLPGTERVRVLSWPLDRAVEAGSTPAAGPSTALLREVMSAGQRGHDWVVVDVPRTVQDDVLSVLGRCDHAVLVVRPTIAGVSSAARTVDRLREVALHAGAVVRVRRGAASATDVARAVGLPLVAELPDQRRLDEHLDLGLGPVHQRRGTLAKAAAALLDRLGVS